LSNQKNSAKQEEVRETFMTMEEIANSAGVLLFVSQGKV
jgi:hypothetical protein